MEHQGAAKTVLRKFTVNPQSNEVRKDEVIYVSDSVDCDLQNIVRKIKHMANNRDTLNGYTTSHNEDPIPSGRQTSSQYSDSCHRRPMISSDKCNSIGEHEMTEVLYGLSVHRLFYR
jgi:hypothetical protein